MTVATEEKQAFAAPTKIDMPQEQRAKSIAVLQARLADTIDFSAMTKQAHWNVKGPAFIALHKLFDELHDVVEGYVDELAERLVALGGEAAGTCRMVAAGSSLEEYPAGIASGKDHVEAISGRLADLAGKVRASIEDADDIDDVGTEDLLTGMVRDLDKYLWFVEAHYQADT